MRTSFRFALTMTALGAALVAGAVQAQDVRLAYRDLDLSKPAQARVLDGRIQAAARNWCAQQAPATGSLLRHDSECRADVRNALVDALPSASRAAYRTAMAQPVTTQELAAAR